MTENATTTSSRSKISRIFAWILVIGILIGISLLARSMFFSILDGKVGVGVSIIAGCSTIIITALSALLQKHLERRAEILRSIREKKIPIYEEVLAGFFELIYRDKPKEQKSEDELGIILRGPIPKFIAWASDEVVLSYSRVRQLSVTHTAEGGIIAFALADMMMEMRKDLGHKNTNLGHLSLLQLFVNEPLQTLNNQAKKPADE